MKKLKQRIDNHIDKPLNIQKPKPKGSMIYNRFSRIQFQKEMKLYNECRARRRQEVYQLIFLIVTPIVLAVLVLSTVAMIRLF